MPPTGRADALHGLLRCLARVVKMLCTSDNRHPHRGIKPISTTRGRHLNEGKTSCFTFAIYIPLHHQADYLGSIPYKEMLSTHMRIEPPKRLRLQL